MKKKDIYIQDSISSCGACCIRSVVSYYGGYLPLEIALEDTMTDKSGTNAYHMVRALINYGFDAHGMNIPFEELNNYRLPMIVHVVKNGLEHFIVVFRVEGKKVLAMDPEFGKYEYDAVTFKDIYDEKAIVIVPVGKIIEMKKSLSIYKLVLSTIINIKYVVFLFILLSIFTIIINFLLSFHLKFLEFSKNPLQLTIAFIIIKTLSMFILYLKTFLQNKIFNYLENHISNRVLEHIFYLPIRYLKNKRVGEIAKKIEELTKVKESIIQLLFVFPIDLLLLIVATTGMVTLSKILTLIYLCFAIVYSIVIVIINKKLYSLNKDSIESYQEYSSNIVEFISGLSSIKNIGSEKYYLNKLNILLNKYLKSGTKANLKETRTYLFKNNILDIANFFITFIGFINISNNFTLIDLMTLMSLISLWQNSLESIVNIVLDAYKNRIVARNVSEFLDVSEEHDGLICPRSMERIDIVDLSYSYDKLNYVLKKMNLTILKGDKIFLRGSSGAGKSTLVKCITNIIDNYQGKIFLHGIDIKKISVSSLKEQIIYIGQEETLFRDSIKENIVVGDYNREKFERVCKIAFVDEILNKRVEKENTVLLEGATNISGGEKSRIILARALYKNPSLLIIDETLSSVSEQMEDEILNNLTNIDDLSIIYITHRNKKRFFNKIITI